MSHQNQAERQILKSHLATSLHLQQIKKNAISKGFLSQQEINVTIPGCLTVTDF